MLQMTGLGMHLRARPGRAIVVWSTLLLLAGLLAGPLRSATTAGVAPAFNYGEALQKAIYFYELVWGAIWLYLASGETSYLTKAEQY
ncbi:MAG TPA: hypothetical protein VGF67_27965 [Ktedonobacteraceae bacterium]|jgi:hypothetical protein